MNICLIGKNLTTLVLSKIFINNGIKVDLYYYDNKTSENMSNTNTRTIGLSMTVLSF